MRRLQSGFTLIEMVVALALLGTMLLLLYSGLTFGLRGWDAADVNGRRTADRRIAENFLRREIGETFPMRFKDPTALKVAFEGKENRLRFVSSRPAGISASGLSLVSIEIETDDVKRARGLVMRRAMPDDEAKDFAPLDKGERTVLFEGVEGVAFEYFGAENDFTDPKWVEAWDYAGRVPQLIRIRLRAADGSYLPEMIVRVMLGEEAGCLESAFQRVCRPRRPA
ncbi:MAG: prepilin-type N-terminal cleavage/methylation domain-containing protein [Usitatibacter sp.]